MVEGIGALFAAVAGALPDIEDAALFAERPNILFDEAISLGGYTMPIFDICLRTSTPADFFAFSATVELTLFVTGSLSTASVALFCLAELFGG